MGILTGGVCNHTFAPACRELDTNGTDAMKPPIFSIRPSGSTAQQYMHRARMFRAAAGDLPDYSNGEQY